MRRGTLIIFVKAPKAGRVKTRLAREIGVGRAAAIFRHLTALTLTEADKLEREADLVLAVDPRAELRAWGHLWPPAFARVAQCDGDLGARLSAALQSAPRGPVVVIGADAPLMRAGHIRQAFRALARADAVFGPAEDGGFWLIGLARRNRAPRLFKGVRWSSRHTLADTLKSLPKGFAVEQIKKLCDIDDAKDLRAAGPLVLSRAAPRR